MSTVVLPYTTVDCGFLQSKNPLLIGTSGIPAEMHKNDVLQKLLQNSQANLQHGGCKLAKHRYYVEPAEFLSAADDEF